jgi:hypothetical protein
MKIIDQQHRIRCRAFKKKGGSIMIWTVMLGLLLTSVFFFFSMRQRMMLSVQRDTAAMQNAKLFLESYADYLEKLCKGGGCASDPKTVDSDGTKGSVTQKVDSIENLVDFGQGQEQDYIFGGSIYVSWNRCSDAMKGDLLVNEVLYKHQAPTTCKDYDDLIGPINVTSPFTIRTQSAPLYFKIKAAAGTQLIDNQWHLELSKDLDYGNKVTIQRTFR